MATFADITLGSLVFKPATRDNATNTVTYEERSGGVALGYKTLKIRKVQNTSAHRTRAVLSFPVLQTPAGAGADGFTPSARLSHYNSFSFEAVNSVVSSSAEREAIIAAAVAMVQSELTNALIIAQETITG